MEDPPPLPEDQQRGRDDRQDDRQDKEQRYRSRSAYSTYPGNFSRPGGNSGGRRF